MDQGLFVMVDSDIEEEELMSFISQKRIKMKKACRQRTVNKDSEKMSSVSSSPASSSPPPESDDNASTCSLSSTGFVPFHVTQSKLKRQRIDDNRNETVQRSKTIRLDNISSAYSDSKNREVIRKTPAPSSWHSVNSSHYIFSDDDDDDDDENNSVCKVSNRNFLPKKHKTSLKTHGARNGLQSSLCLTGCKSCKEYSLPNVSEQESNEMDCYLALDCEFVGVGPNNKSALGRCSIVDHRGHILFDRFVKPPDKVTDYRTRWSGLRPHHICSGIPFIAAQEMIAAVIKDKVVIGHAVHNDFRVMDLKHPVHLIRDTASCKLLREMANLPSNASALRKLTSALLGRTIQKKEHCSVTDARACLDLFRLVRTQWEPTLLAKFQRRAARHSQGEPRVTDHVSSSDPELSSFLDDQYWPDELFEESFG
ncbi:apoptosis-enhancing nuclease-like [Babylonia areolata]|uniref:apoptosis-enhancing nuclease-like n=1 Tax=Babylonia areolata TaxID=304850 RepID=UPI003FD2DB0A